MNFVVLIWKHQLCQRAVVEIVEQETQHVFVMVIHHELRKLAEHIVVAHTNYHVGMSGVFLFICKVVSKTFQNSLSPAHHQIVGLLLLQLIPLLLHIPEYL